LGTTQIYQEYPFETSSGNIGTLAVNDEDMDEIAETKNTTLKALLSSSR
jgi:hypothetical protein